MKNFRQIVELLKQIIAAIFISDYDEIKLCLYVVKVKLFYSSELNEWNEMSASEEVAIDEEY